MSTHPRDTASGKPPEDDHWDDSAPAGIDPKTKQHRDYWVLPESERARGFVRPVRTEYRHEKCGTVTTMPRTIAETYGRDPLYYGTTFCFRCQDHLPVGKDGEFVWTDDGSKVGT